MMEPSKKQKHIEFAKSVIIVVLFLSAILLLYGFWWNAEPGQINLENIGNQNGTFQSLSPQEVIAPAVIEISYGDGRFGVVDNDTLKYWWNPEGNSFTEIMVDFFATGNIFVESITKEQYREVLLSESIKVTFDYDIPFKDACKLYGILQPSGMGNISNLSEVAYSYGSMESLFICDRKENQFYRIVGDESFSKTNDFNAIYEALDQESYVAYPLYQLLGEGTENPVLVPLPSEFAYTISTYKNERIVGEPEFERTLAQTFFGETFDFTRVIEDAKGGITYMYGYGERVFVAESDGSFRYKREGGNKKKLSQMEGLEISLDFIASHGGTKNSSGEIENIRLLKVKKEEGKGSKITFYFQIQKDEALLYEEGAPFIVECTGDIVTSFYRDLSIVDKTQKQNLSAGEYTAANVLAKNFEMMANTLQSQGVIEYNNNEAFQAVGDAIKGIRLVETRFRKTGEGVGKMETCWDFSFRKNGKTVDFYYSIKDALPMGYSVR